MRAKPTSQQRSQEKRDRILTAMDALLLRKSFAEISVADLAAKAKVAQATIYQRFSNADATASVLMELYFRHVEAWARRRRQPPRRGESLFEALVTLASDAHDQVAALGYVMRPAYLYRGTGPTVRARSGLGSNRWHSTASRRFYSNGRRRSGLTISIRPPR